MKILLNLSKNVFEFPTQMRHKVGTLVIPIVESLMEYTKSSKLIVKNLFKGLTLTEKELFIDYYNSLLCAQSDLECDL